MRIPVALSGVIGSVPAGPRKARSIPHYPSRPAYCQHCSLIESPLIIGGLFDPIYPDYSLCDSETRTSQSLHKSSLRRFLVTLDCRVETDVRCPAVRQNCEHHV